MLSNGGILKQKMLPFGGIGKIFVKGVGKGDYGELIRIKVIK